MPLEHNASKEAVGRNIEREQAAGKPHEQAVAIALQVQREAADAAGLSAVFQTHFDETGTGPGNCMQAAVASLLGLKLDEVPNFITAAEPFAALNEFMRSRDYDMVRMPEGFTPWGNYLVTGVSTRGYEHMVVYRAGHLAFDPNPHGQPGLVSVSDVYWPVPLTKKAAEVLQ